MVVMGEEAYMVGGIGQSSVEVMIIMMMVVMFMRTIIMLMMVVVIMRVNFLLKGSELH